MFNTISCMIPSKRTVFAFAWFIGITTDPNVLIMTRLTEPTKATTKPDCDVTTELTFELYIVLTVGVAI